MIQHQNITTHDHCPICEDEGMVELKGTVTVHGVTYSRGSTTCKWCEEGARRYVRAISPPRGKNDHHRKWQPAQDYTLEDVGLPEDSTPLPRHEATKLLAAIRPTLGQP
jgi:hypothetical protein